MAEKRATKQATQKRLFLFPIEGTPTGPAATFRAPPSADEERMKLRERIVALKIPLGIQRRWL